MIRREGHDPLQYTISRRGKKMPGGSHQQSAGLSPSANQDWDQLDGNVPAKRRRDHDYEDNVMYR